MINLIENFLIFSVKYRVHEFVKFTFVVLFFQNSYVLIHNVITFETMRLNTRLSDTEISRGAKII